VNTIYSALFVDFDNMYSRLKETCGKDVAEKFALQPICWLEWLCNDLPLAHFGYDNSIRRILIRKCYLNPGVYGQYRPYFTKTGFEVVDCPQLTNEGKTSTDIHIVMDIMDALQHPSQFDEFILLSADADFTPVLLRVRQHKRMSIVIAAGYSSPAYRSACDYLPPLELFVQEALRMGPVEDLEKPYSPPVTTPDAVLEELASVILQELNTVDIVYDHELPRLYKRVSKFRESTNWLGYYSLRSLTRAIVDRSPELEIYEDRQMGSWGVQRNGNIDVTLRSTSKPDGPIQKPAAGAPLVDERRENFKNRITQAIIEYVRLSPKPVTMAQLASLVKDRFADELRGYDNWLGVGSFKALLRELDLGGLEINNTVPGYVYDPRRHPSPVTISYVNPITEEFMRRYPEIEPIAAKIHQLTDMPYLLPEHYALLFQQIVRTVKESGFHLSTTTRIVRDRCVERGAPVARAHVNFVVIGLNYAGLQLGDPDAQLTPAVLAEYLYKNTLNLCQAAQFTLLSEEESLARAWLMGALEETSPIE